MIQFSKNEWTHAHILLFSNRRESVTNIAQISRKLKIFRKTWGREFNLPVFKVQTIKMQFLVKKAADRERNLTIFKNWVLWPSLILIFMQLIKKRQFNYRGNRDTWSLRYRMKFLKKWDSWWSMIAILVYLWSCGYWQEFSLQSEKLLYH